jgi:hypothetical protein
MKKFVVLIVAGLAACANAQQYGDKVNDTSTLVKQGEDEARKMWHHTKDAWDDIVNGKTDADSSSQVPKHTLSTSYSGRKSKGSSAQSASSNSQSSSGPSQSGTGQSGAGQSGAGTEVQPTAADLQQ